MPNLHKITRGTLPFWMTAAVMAVFLVVFLIAPVAAPGTRMMTAEFVKQYELESSYDQRLGFLAAVITIAVLSGAAYFLRRRNLPHEIGANSAPSVGLLFSAAAVAVLLALYAWFVQGWIVKAATITAIGVFTFALIAPYIRRRTVESIVLVLGGAYLAMVVMPGLLVRPIFWPVIDADSIAQLELHINSLVQPGSNIAAGQTYFTDIPFGYGILMPSIMSVIERRFGPLSVGGHAMFVQWCQIAFIILATLCYYFFRPRNYLGILVALLLAAPYWATTSIGIWHPNQTGFRSLTLPLGILTIAFCARLPLNWAAAYLGAIEMICLLINPETGVAVGGGMVVYLLLRTRSIPIKAFFWMAASAIATFVLYLLLYRLALGRLPFGGLGTILTTFLAHVSGGVGLRLFTAGQFKEGYFIVPLALVMFAHATYVVISSFQKLGDRALPHRQALKAAIATILIAWFAYYINFPNWWQIWTHLFLYGLLIIDLFDLRLFAVGRAGTIAPIGIRHFGIRVTHLAPMFLVLMMLLHTNANLGYFNREFLAPYWVRDRGGFEATTLSGMQVPRAAADALVEKSKYLRELYDKNGGKVLYLTYNVEFVPMLTRIFESTPARSMWGFITTDEALDPAIGKMMEAKPAAILIDAPTGPLAVSGARKEFQDRWRKSVGRAYHLTETTNGWQVWRPNNP